MTCYVCLAGQVSSFQICTPCHTTCQTCNGLTFLECSSCDKKSYLKLSTCITLYHWKVIYSPGMISSAMTPTIQILVIIYICICIFLELIFEYKTNLLPVLQTLQIISYTYYLSFSLSQNTQLTALFLYISNLSFLFKPLQIEPSVYLPSKFGLMGKTGYFFVDGLGVNIILLSVIVLHLGAKHFSKRYKVIHFIYKKINPYLIAYTFRLVFL